jgi:hypothetical protein
MVDTLTGRDPSVCARRLRGLSVTAEGRSAGIRGAGSAGHPLTNTHASAGIGSFPGGNRPWPVPSRTGRRECLCDRPHNGRIGAMRSEAAVVRENRVSPSLHPERPTRATAGARLERAQIQPQRRWDSRAHPGSLDRPQRRAYKRVSTAVMKESTAFRMDPQLLAAMRRVRTIDGIPVSVQVDFAVRDWLKRRGIVIEKEAARKAAGNRRKRG